MNGYLIISLIWELFTPVGAGGASDLPVYARLSHSGNGRLFLRRNPSVKKVLSRIGTGGVITVDGYLGIVIIEEDVA